MSLKIKEYTAERLVEHGITTCFYVNGGAIAPLVDQLSYDERFETYACLHEASATYAAEGFTRRTGKPSAVLVTSGPGGTNALTGLNCCWTDSIPVLFISGQVSSNQLIGENRIRQRGVQETDILKLTQSISKVSLRIESAIDYKCVDEALCKMVGGRPGPVWIDICINAFNDILVLAGESFVRSKPRQLSTSREWIIPPNVLHRISGAKKPLIIAGSGLKVSAGLKESLVNYGIPIVSTWAGQPYVSDAQSYIGNIGLFGDRGANSAVQEADVIFAIGTSLNICHTGYDSKSFGRNAFIVHFDIDEGELTKNNYHDSYLGLQVDVRDPENAARINQILLSLVVDSGWSEHVKQRSEYTAVVENKDSYREHGYVNSYDLVDIVNQSKYEFDVVTDMGTSFTCTHQSFRQTESRRIITAGGHAPMGWGVAGAIGAAIGMRAKKVVCITGDGGLLMSLQDLRSHTGFGLDIVNIVLDNDGYLTMRHTMQNTFGRISGCSEESGIVNPDFKLIAESMKMKYKYVVSKAEFSESFAEAMEGEKGSVMIHVRMKDDQELKPRLASYVDSDGVKHNYPLDNMYPHNNRDFGKL